MPRMNNFRRLPQSLLVLLTAASSALAVPSPWQPVGESVLQTAAPGSTGAVASESKICSEVGINLLARGVSDILAVRSQSKTDSLDPNLQGNAVDTFVGTQLCVGVIGMHHSGLGGGGFSLVRDKNGNYTVIDYRESAPAAAFEDMYKGNVRGSIVGGLAAGVPGELAGLEKAHKEFGVLPWKAVVRPAAYVARNGFPVSEDLVRYMAYGIAYAGWNFLVEDPSWALDFAPHGSLLTLGETMYRKRYAETLEKVAEHGADVFYTGAMADATIDYLQKYNGTMTLDDLSNYQAIIRQPVNITYHGFNLYSSGAPSSGAVCLSTLKTMEGYDASDTADVNLTLHRFDEAMRFAYGAHQALGDPDFLSDVDKLEYKMLDASEAASIRQRILDNSTQPVKNYDPDEIYTSESHGTSHIVTADASGMAVSSTTTVNLLFGNLLMVPETGVILNNEMNDFSIPGVTNQFGYAPSEANFIRPNKRPLSSITPVIIEHSNGTLLATVGAAGGSRIISSTTQVTWHVLGRAMTMRDAIKEPRFHDQLMPNEVVFEYSFENSTVASMAEKGHNVTWVREGISAVQGIKLAGDGIFESVGETRQKNSGGLSI
ncbi:Uu.00g077560.m01.CDS01 [Anthostomella pinea]|uniref:Glutathione hydrolase n=1 Tax=Anthostomella pinea TaxID=933095 RepID=A0AAI8VQD8_9PEZI|nr:Uu.00g077560.m01.CDS01 [Anthostomella pinea]